MFSKEETLEGERRDCHPNEAKEQKIVLLIENDMSRYPPRIHI